MYDPVVGRWISVDPARQFASPYVGMGNSPVMGVDPDGNRVIKGSEADAKKTVKDLNEVYPGIPVDYKRIDYEKSYLFGLIKTTEVKYQLTVNDDSDFDWCQDQYSEALYDVIVTKDITFEIVYTNRAPYVGGKMADLQDFGGGFAPPETSTYRKIYLDPRGYLRTGDPSSVILMHELISHGHPVATPTSIHDMNAHDINYFFHKKLGISPKAPYRKLHQGYKGDMNWRKTDLYQKEF